MDETQDPKPHPRVDSLSNVPHEVAPDAKGKHTGRELSIWFFCGILTLGYGIVLIGQGLLEHFHLLGQGQPDTVLANLQPTFWWGICLFIFGLFYSVRFRPGKG